jgi:hypothetical protein
VRPSRATMPVRSTVLNHARVLAGNISFGQSNTDAGKNTDTVYASGTSNATQNAAFSVNHQLGRIPVGFHVINKDKAGDFYASGTAWTATTISLKCTVASVTFTLLLL